MVNKRGDKGKPKGNTNIVEHAILANAKRGSEFDQKVATLSLYIYRAIDEGLSFFYALQGASKFEWTPQ